MKQSRKQKYGENKPNGKSRYALKKAARARVARGLGMPIDTPLPVLRSPEISDEERPQPAPTIDLAAGL
jgi:hypothetical protein